MQTLNEIRVLDLGCVLAPYCTMVLGDLEADVIKVEWPRVDEIFSVHPVEARKC